jgi:hypothetical protein
MKRIVRMVLVRPAPNEAGRTGSAGYSMAAAMSAVIFCHS